MTELNLLNYINLSQSEIYQIEHDEIEQTQENTESKSFSLVGINIPTTFLFAGIGVCLTLAIAVVIYFSLTQETPLNDNATTADNAILDNATIPDKDASRFTKEFVTVGSISFKEEATETIEKKTPPAKSKPKKAVNKKQQTKKQLKMPPVKTITLAANTKKSPQTKPVNIKSTPHYAVFDDISRQELIQLKKKVKQKRLSYSVAKTKLRTNKVWQLYRQDPAGKKRIADRSVIFIKNFNKKDSAVTYAKKHQIPAIIISKEIEERYYFINVYPFSSQKTAISFSKSTAFPKKSVRIIKGQP